VIYTAKNFWWFTSQKTSGSLHRKLLVIYTANKLLVVYTAKKFWWFTLQTSGGLHRKQTDLP
jgi:hypothetical protein